MTPGSMQIGIGTYTYGWAVGVEGDRPPMALSELDLVQRAVSFGISLLQVGDNLPLHTFTGERLGIFKEHLQRQGVRLEIGARGLTAARLAMYVPICRYLDAGLLRFIIDGEDYHPTLEETGNIIRASLPLLHRHNLTLAIENHDRFKAKELGEMIAWVGSGRVGICLDSVNSIGAAEGLETVISYLAPHAVNLHLKDFGIVRLPHRQGFIVEGRIAGQGMLDIPALMKKVRSYGKCPSCILEQWVPPEENLRATISKEEDWAQESIRYLLKQNAAFNTL